MRFSYSRVDCFNSCPYKFKLHYIDDLQLIPYQAEPNNALIVGNTIHKAIESDFKIARRDYLSNYPVVNNNHILELIKIEIQAKKVKEILKKVKVYRQEYMLSTSRFVGIVDLMTMNDDGSVDIFDFKYSNNIEKYLESAQLHIYKYFLEEIGFKVRKLGFIFIPKNNFRQKKTEDLYQFRKRVIDDVSKSEIKIVEVKYDPNKVINFVYDINRIILEKEYSKNESKLCDWCEYKKYCKEGDKIMILPSNQRREKKIDTNPDMWVYGDSYVGKSTFVDKFDDLLFINTDGNVDNTTSPVIRIADTVTTEGRMIKRTSAWDNFLEVVTELEKKDNSFKVICIDLIEDLYEHCRVHTHKKLGIQHESDSGFGKGWDIVRTEFLSTIKRLKNIGYQIIYISKEVSNEVTLRSGAKFSTYKPNLQDKIANVIAGTVDLTARVYMDNGKRYIQLNKDENTFGGGRFNFDVDKCELDMKVFKDVLIKAQGEVKEQTKEEPVKEVVVEEVVKEEPPKKKRRKKADEVVEELTYEPVDEDDIPF